MKKILLYPIYGFILCTLNADQKNNIMNISFLKPANIQVVIPSSDISKSSYPSFEFFKSKEGIIEGSGDISYKVLAIRNDENNKTYIVPYSNGFYIFKNDDILTFELSSSGILNIQKSLLQLSNQDENSISKYVRDNFSINRLIDLLSKISKIDLRSSAPVDFFTAGSDGSSISGDCTLKSYSFEESLVKITILSDLKVYTGDFWIDIDSNKVIRSRINNVEYIHGPQIP